jgi:hypothetical protein
MFCGMIVVYIASAEEVSLLLWNVWDFISDMDFHLISSLLCLRGSFNEEILSYFVRSYVNLSAQYFLTNKKTGKNMQYYVIGGYWILILN